MPWFIVEGSGDILYRNYKGSYRDENTNRQVDMSQREEEKLIEISRDDSTNLCRMDKSKRIKYLDKLRLNRGDLCVVTSGNVSKSTKLGIVVDKTWRSGELYFRVWIKGEYKWNIASSDVEAVEQDVAEYFLFTHSVKQVDKGSVVIKYLNEVATYPDYKMLTGVNVTDKKVIQISKKEAAEYLEDQKVRKLSSGEKCYWRDGRNDGALLIVQINHLPNEIIEFVVKDQEGKTHKEVHPSELSTKNMKLPTNIKHPATSNRHQIGNDSQDTSDSRDETNNKHPSTSNRQQTDNGSQDTSDSRDETNNKHLATPNRHQIGNDSQDTSESRDETNNKHPSTSNRQQTDNDSQDTSDSRGVTNKPINASNTRIVPQEIKENKDVINIKIDSNCERHEIATTMVSLVTDIKSICCVQTLIISPCFTSCRSIVVPETRFQWKCCELKWTGLVNGKECVGVMKRDSEYDIVNDGNKFITTKEMIEFLKKDEVQLFLCGEMDDCINLDKIGIKVLNPLKVKEIEKINMINKMYKYEKDKFIKVKEKVRINETEFIGRTEVIGCRYKVPDEYRINGMFFVSIKEMKLCLESDGSHNHYQLDIGESGVEYESVCCIEVMDQLVGCPWIRVNSKLSKGCQKYKCKWIGKMNGEDIVGIESNTIWNMNMNKKLSNLVVPGNEKLIFYRASTFKYGIKKSASLGCNIIDPAVQICVRNMKKIEASRIVYVYVGNDRKRGIVKVAGNVNGNEIVGCEMDTKFDDGSDGTFGVTKLFDCGGKRGVLIVQDEKLRCCEVDGRHNDVEIEKNGRLDETSVCCLETKRKVEGYEKVVVGQSYSWNNGEGWIVSECEWIGIVNGSKKVGRFRFPDRGGIFYNLWTSFMGKDENNIFIGLDKINTDIILCDVVNILIIKPESVTSFHVEEVINKYLVITTHDKKKLAVKAKWRGSVQGSSVIGYEWRKKSKYGTNGEFNGHKLFTCKDERGILMVLEGFTKTCANGSHEQLELWRNKMIKEESICCIEHGEWRTSQFTEGMKVEVNSGTNTVRGICKWIGKINGQFYVGIESNRNLVEGCDGDVFGIELFECKRGHGCLVKEESVEVDIEMISNIFVCNASKLDFTKECGESQYKVGDLVEVVDNRGNQKCVGVFIKSVFIGRRIFVLVNVNQYAKDLYPQEAVYKDGDDKFVVVTNAKIKPWSIPLVKNIYVSNKFQLDYLGHTSNSQYKEGDLVEVDKDKGIGRFRVMLDIGSRLFGKINVTGYVKNISPEAVFKDRDDKYVVVEVGRIKLWNNTSKLTTNDMGVVDMKCILLREPGKSSTFVKDDLFKDKSGKLCGKVVSCHLLNEESCVEFIKTIPLDETRRHYIPESCIDKIDKEPQYYKHVVIIPSSVAQFELMESEIKGLVQFRLRGTQIPHKGRVKRGCKINGTHEAAIVDLTICEEGDKFSDLFINKFDNLKCILEVGEKLNCIMVDIDVLKKAEEEKIYCNVNKIHLINPAIVESCNTKWDGRRICISKDNSKIDTRWIGKINDTTDCIGVQLVSASEYGTDGTFNTCELYKCEDERGGLVSMNEEVVTKSLCLNTNRHKNMGDYVMIGENYICCIEFVQSNDIKFDDAVIVKLADNKVIYGCCRWRGRVNNREAVGLDSFIKTDGNSYGTYNGIDLFECKEKYGYLCGLEKCIKGNIKFSYCNYNKTMCIDAHYITNIGNGRQVDKKVRWNNENILNIKWQGMVNDVLCVGCRMNEQSELATNGIFNGQQLFRTEPHKALLIPAIECEVNCILGDHNPLDGDKEGIVNGNSICCVETLPRLDRNEKIKIGNLVVYKKNNVTSYFDKTGVCNWIGRVNGEEVVGIKLKETKSHDEILPESKFGLFKNEKKNCFLIIENRVEYKEDLNKLTLIGGCVVDLRYVGKLGKFINESDMINDAVYVEFKDKDYKSIKLCGELKWVGKINKILCGGIDLDTYFEHGCDGFIECNKVFNCGKGRGIFVQFGDIKRDDEHCGVTFREDGTVDGSKFLKIETIMWNEVKLKSDIIFENNIVHVVLKGDNKKRLKGQLKWIGKMWDVQVGVVQLKDDHPSGCNGVFWRQKLCEGLKNNIIAVPLEMVEKYIPFVETEIPVKMKKFDIKVNTAVKYYHKENKKIVDIYGTVKWIGRDTDYKYFYGMELDNRRGEGTNGEFEGQRLFHCDPGYGILAPYDRVAKDERFTCDESSDAVPKTDPIHDRVFIKPSIPITNYVGKSKGIQGNQNSCYFDSSILALFLKSDQLDFLFTNTSSDPITQEFQQILQNQIVYPLRKERYVSFHHTQEMREVVKKYGPKYAEMMTQESDMSNVSSLFSKFCPDDQLLKFTGYNGNKNQSMFLQLFITLSEPMKFITSQNMIDLSMLQNEILFIEDPSCLIVQAPRDARGINSYQYVLPSQTIEISRLSMDHTRICNECQEKATQICLECVQQNTMDLECVQQNSIDLNYAYKCDQHKCSHQTTQQLPMKLDTSNSKVYLNLRAIICIEKCHFVSYVKDDATDQWLFFDSMSTQAQSNSFPIPEIKFNKDIDHFMSLNKDDMIHEIVGYKNEHLSKIIRDAYVFIYENPARNCY